MLNDKIESYKKTGKFVAVTPAMYKKDYPFLKEVDSLALANVQLNLQAAFRNHFVSHVRSRLDSQNSSLQSAVENHILQIIRRVLSLSLAMVSSFLR